VQLVQGGLALAESFCAPVQGLEYGEDRFGDVWPGGWIRQTGEGLFHVPLGGLELGKDRGEDGLDGDEGWAIVRWSLAGWLAFMVMHSGMELGGMMLAPGQLSQQNLIVLF
jgi:hypothetical protein